MHGVLIIDKPEGLTSHDVVNRIRRVLGTRRVGHTGTLDPFATGVMVVLIGQATRLAQFIDKDQKEYEATIRFGFETDTGDRTGTPLTGATAGATSTKSDRSNRLGRAAVEKVLPQFTGEIEQVPPMYSAKKVAGKKLYEHARRGETIERAAQRVFIDLLEIVDASRLDAEDPQLMIRVVCSAGTYIRVLAEDIGREIGVGAHLAELRRVRSGRSMIGEAVTLDELAAASDPSSLLLPVERIVEYLPSFTLPAARVERARNGLSTTLGVDPTFDDKAPIRMLDENGSLIAIGRYNAAENSIKPTVVLAIE
jgi:tRNA pseudouridine55 synthase